MSRLYFYLVTTKKRYFQAACQSAQNKAFPFVYLPHPNMRFSHIGARFFVEYFKIIQGSP
jgi:hypothetical protein